jgi:APA family basic amino acid/polyamine antiporter
MNRKKPGVSESAKKYGLATAICMVVGIVIGSGVFFKAEAVLKATGGNMPMGILAWLIVGVIMIVCSYVFATMATRYSKVNGLVDYAEATVGSRYAYNIGWFMATLYTPCLVSVLAWVSARYTCVLLGWDITGGACMTIACFYLCADFVMNALSPRIAGKFQVSTTVIKMIPLALMAVIGTIAGLTNGRMAANFTATAVAVRLRRRRTHVLRGGRGLRLRGLDTGHLHQRRAQGRQAQPAQGAGGRLLHRGVTYILYYIGLTGAVDTADLMKSGEAGAKMAFQHLFGNAAGTGVFVLIVISCLGTLNGLTLSNCRAFYAMAARGEGPGQNALPGGPRHRHALQLLPAQPGVLGCLAAVFLRRQSGRRLVRLLQLRFLGAAHHHAVRHVYPHVRAVHPQGDGPCGAFKRYVMPVLGLSAARSWSRLRRLCPRQGGRPLSHRVRGVHDSRQRGPDLFAAAGGGGALLLPQAALSGREADAGGAQWPAHRIGAGVQTPGTVPGKEFYGRDQKAAAVWF